VPREVKNEFPASAAESVDALVVVANHTQVTLSVKQAANKAILHAVAVLELIYEHVLEPFLVELPYAGNPLEYPDGQANQVIQVNEVTFSQLVVITCQYLAEQSLLAALGLRQFTGFLPGVLCHAYSAQDVPRVGIAWCVLQATQD
jgi:hypothetical protein